MISTDSFFRVSSDRIDPDYGLDDGTKVRFQNPIPRQSRPDSAVRIFSRSFGFFNRPSCPVNRRTIPSANPPSPS